MENTRQKKNDNNFSTQKLQGAEREIDGMGSSTDK